MEVMVPKALFWKSRLSSNSRAAVSKVKTSFLIGVGVRGFAFPQIEWVERKIIPAARLPAKSPILFWGKKIEGVLTPQKRIYHLCQ